MIHRDGGGSPEPAGRTSRSPLISSTDVRTDGADSRPRAAGQARVAVAWVAAALVVAAVVRLPRSLADDFPINDGGIFFVMVNELVGAGLALPPVTSYNGAAIPFAYPPFAPCLAAALHAATGASVLGLLRFLPLTANLATVAVCFFLCRRVLGTPLRAGLATLIVVLLPRSYEYLIMGGGLTRSFGFLFACCAIACGWRFFAERRLAAGIATAVALALSALSHPEMGLWAAASLALVGAASGPSRRTLAAAAAAAAGAAVLASPWWVAVLARHGIGPFLAASETSAWSAHALLGVFSRGVGGEVGRAPFAILGLVGFVDAVVRRELLVPAWLAATFVVVPRSAPTAAVVPLGLLAARALLDVVFPALERPAASLSRRWRVTPVETGREARWGARWLVRAAVLAPVFGYTIVASNLARTPAAWPSMSRVSPAEREAMAWVAANVSADSRFVVLSASRDWWTDPVGEWFPAIAGRTSVATPNGTEWIPRGEFARRLRARAELRSRRAVSAEFLDDWSARFSMEFTHVYVSKAGTQGPAAGGVPSVALGAGGAFAVVYDGPGATVFARRRAGVEPAPPGIPPRGAAAS